MTTASISVQARMSDRPRNEVVIGTADDCDIQITGDPCVSSRHAKVVRAVQRNPVNGCPGISELSDLGSTNGTRVHRRALKLKCGPGIFITLMPGDIIQIGTTLLRWSGEVDRL